MGEESAERKSAIMQSLLLGLLLPCASAFQLAAVNVPRAAARSAAARMETAEATRCAFISLSPEDPLRLAKVLKKAWMEGGVKRGLVGSVLVGESAVRIACQGPVSRLQSFANWIEQSSMLVTGVEMVDTEECPTDQFTQKFPLADAEPYSGGVPGSFAGELADVLSSISLDVKSKQGATHSNDEGLF